MSEYSDFPPAEPPQYYPPPPQAQWYPPPGLELAGWWLRFGAQFLDNLLTGVIPIAVGVGLGFATAGASSNDDTGAAVGLIAYVVVVVAVLLLYEPLTMRRAGERNGQTWAKQWLGIRVVRDDGRPVTAGTALLRDVLMQSIVFGFLGSCFLYVPILLDSLWPLWDERKQTLHDKVASTYVIKA